MWPCHRFLPPSQVQPFLVRLHKLLGERPQVRRVQLLSGHVAVGLRVPSELLEQFLSSDEDRSAACVGSDENAFEMAESRADARWCALLEDSLRTQRKLQEQLPAHADEGDGWQECWATIRQHESEDLEPDELIAHRERQGAVNDFALSIQRQKREQARAAARSNAFSIGGLLGGAASAAVGTGTAKPTPAPYAVPARLPSPVAASGAKPPAAPTVSNATGAGASAFMPAVGSARSSAAAQRAAAQSALHPLLQTAATAGGGGFMPAVSTARSSAAVQRAAAQSTLHPLLQMAARKQKEC